MGNFACCISNPPNIPTTDINNKYVPKDHPAILSLSSISSTRVLHNTSIANEVNDNNLQNNKITDNNINKDNYNAMIMTRDRNLTNTSNSTNYSSIEQLYEPAPVHNNKLVDSDHDDVSNLPHTGIEDKISNNNQIIHNININDNKLKHHDHLPLPLPNPKDIECTVSIPTNTKSQSPLIKGLSYSKSIMSSQLQIVGIISNTPPGTPSPPLRSLNYNKKSSTSMSISSLNLNLNNTNNNRLSHSHSLYTSNMPTLKQKNEKKSIKFRYSKQKIEKISKSQTICSCDNAIKLNEIYNDILDLVIIPSPWSDYHDEILKYMLKYWKIIDLFNTLRSYIYEPVIRKPITKYHRRIRNGLSICPFCPCWYDIFTNGFRIIQFGYCPGTTQFALRFTRNKDKDDDYNNNYDNSSEYSTKIFESRSKFSTTINTNKLFNNNSDNISDNSDKNRELFLEIFDMNIAEFPTMIPAYLSSYNPHVILLLFDVSDRSSFDGIKKMRKRLEQIYESLQEQNYIKNDINSNSNSNSNKNLKRFHDSFDAITNAFKFGSGSGTNNDQQGKTSRSSSVVSLFNNIASSLNLNKDRDKDKKLKNINLPNATTLSSKYSASSVDKSNINDFTTLPLSGGIPERDIDTDNSHSNNNKIQSQACNQYTHCYYHDNDYNGSSSSMPPILIVGICADIDESDRSVSIEEGLKLSKEWEVPYIEASSLNGINVNDVFIESIRTRWVYDTYPDGRDRSRAVHFMYSY